MQITIVVMCLMVATLASPVPDVGDALLQNNFERDAHGQYAYSFLTGDNVARTEQGSLVPNKDGTANVLVTRGSYSYIGADGEKVVVSYTADENGYVATGTHLPTPPSIPVV